MLLAALGTLGFLVFLYFLSRLIEAVFLLAGTVTHIASMLERLTTAVEEESGYGD